MVGPGHGEGDELLELPAARPALGGRGLLGRRGDQVPGIAEQELPAVAPVFVRLALAAQRLHPGGYPRVLAQVLGHLLRHVGAWRGRAERAGARTEPKGGGPGWRGGGGGYRGASGRPAPAPAAAAALPPAAPQKPPDNRARRRRTAHFRRPRPRSLL